MKGRVKMFNEEKGYGFILGDDANDYFVHITEVKSVDTLTRGTIVEFQPAETERGKVAKGVSVSESVVKRPAFVEFGDTRIKMSNIKNYGISSAPVYYARVFEKIETEPAKKGLLWLIAGNPITWRDTGECIRLSESKEEAEKLMERWVHVKGVYSSEAHYREVCCKIKRYVKTNGVISDGETAAKFEDVITCKTVKYLYVTTFQNDNYRFYVDMVDFDIHEKCKELDTYAI